MSVFASIVLAPIVLPIWGIVESHRQRRKNAVGLPVTSGVQPRVSEPAVLLPVNVSAAQDSPTHIAAKPVTTTMAAGVIEIDMSGARVRVRGAVDQASLQGVLQALRALA